MYQFDYSHTYKLQHSTITYVTGLSKPSTYCLPYLADSGYDELTPEVVVKILGRLTLLALPLGPLLVSAAGTDQGNAVRPCKGDKGV